MSPKINVQETQNFSKGMKTVDSTGTEINKESCWQPFTTDVHSHRYIYMYVRNISGLNIYEDIRAFRLQGYPCISPNSIRFQFQRIEIAEFYYQRRSVFPLIFPHRCVSAVLVKKLCGYFGLGSEVFRHISILGPILCFLGGTEFY